MMWGVAGAGRHPPRPAALAAGPGLTARRWAGTHSSAGTRGPT